MSSPPDGCVEAAANAGHIAGSMHLGQADGGETGTLLQEAADDLPARRLAGKAGAEGLRESDAADHFGGSPDGAGGSALPQENGVKGGEGGEVVLVFEGEFDGVSWRAPPVATLSLGARVPHSRTRSLQGLPVRRRRPGGLLGSRPGCGARRNARAGGRIGRRQVHPAAPAGRSRQAFERYDILRKYRDFRARGLGAGGFPQSGNWVRLADSLSPAGIYGAGERDDAVADSGMAARAGGLGVVGEVG